MCNVILAFFTNFDPKKAQQTAQKNEKRLHPDVKTCEEYLDFCWGAVGHVVVPLDEGHYTRHVDLNHATCV